MLTIVQAFRPGKQLDLPANVNAPDAAALTLPDVLADVDLLTAMPDASLLLTQPSDLDFGRHDEDVGDWTSSLQPLDFEQGRNIQEEQPQLLDAEGMEIDFGDDIVDEGPSIEVGRDAPAARPVAEDIIADDSKLFDGDGLPSGIAESEPARTRHSTAVPSAYDDINNFLGVDEDTAMGGADDFGFRLNDDEPQAAAASVDRRLRRESQSPLSSARSSVVRNLESTIFEPGEEASVHHAHRAKKRKIIQPDADTVLHNSEIKARQDDRSKILKPASFLPRDPVLLTLMNMQRNGGFVSNIMGDGRGKGWAPELRGILSLEVVRRSGELKRKRDSGTADMGDKDVQSSTDKAPQLDLGEEEEDNFAIADEGVAFGEDTTNLKDRSEILSLPAANDNDDLRMPTECQPSPAPPPATVIGSDDDAMTPAAADPFDRTTLPLLHPSDSGPVSLGTKHAVHLLRDHFGPAAADSPSQRTKASVLFQDLLPERTTARADATKMFFEVLVLATKDAVKVEQKEGELGGALRVRGKRGLWGAWAEREAGGEIEIGIEGLPSQAGAVAGVEEGGV